jgi:hypothetical protein
MRLRIACLSIVAAACSAVPAQASTQSRAARAVEHKAERRYSEGRHVIAFCHKRAGGRRYFCEYLILANFTDGVRAGEEGRERVGPAGEGDARVEVEGSTLIVRLLGEPNWN